MSTLKTTAIQHLNGSSPAISLQPNNNVTFANNVYITGQTGQVTNPLQIKFSNDYPGAGGASSNTASKMKLVFYDNSPINIYSIGVGPSADMQYHAYQGTAGIGSHNFYTENLNRMKIDGSGRVTMPYQPYARGSYSGGDLAANNVLPINANIASRGEISTGSNRFTVPVTGAYVVGYSHLAASAGGQAGIRKNGTLIPGTRSQGSGAHYCLSSLTVIDLAVNDYIDFWVVNNSIHGNSDYNSMWIYLLG